MKEFTVRVDMGDVFINGEFVAQLCWDNDSIGSAVTNWLDGIVDDSDSEIESDYVYVPRLEEVNGINNMVMYTWDDWGVFSTEEAARNCIPKILEAIDMYPDPDERNHYSIAIEVHDAETYHLEYIIDVIDNVEEELK